MPLTKLGESYREFSEPRFFEAETVAHVRAIPWPVDKAFALQGVASGGAQTLYKFDSGSVAADNGTTILKPLNPFYTALGRWYSVLTGTNSGGGGGGSNFLSGHGNPNAAVVGTLQGQTYLDLDTGSLWAFGGTPSTNTGWV